MSRRAATVASWLSRRAPATLVALAMAFGLAAGAVAPAAAAAPLPWSALDDVTQFPRLRDDLAVRLVASAEVGDGAYDRHSPTSPRYQRRERGEAILFETDGPGALVRLWMTTGDGTSQPLPSWARVRIYLDGSEAPAIDLPLPRLFDGSTPPFERPLVADRERASGGNISHVPIPYRRGCRVTLLGWESLKLWYQIHHLSFAGEPPPALATFPADPQPARALARRFDRVGDDPWRRAGRWRSGRAALDPAAPLILLERSGVGHVTGLRLRVEPQAWETTRLRATVDGRKTIDVLLADLWGVSADETVPDLRPPDASPPDASPPDETRRDETRAGSRRSTVDGSVVQVEHADPAASLWTRVDRRGGELDLWLPMPFDDGVRLWLERGVARRAPLTEPIGLAAMRDRARPLEVSWRVRVDPRPPAVDAGRLEIRTRAGEGVGHASFTVVEGRGRWIGLGARLVGGRGAATYLEGDERVWIDATERAEPPRPAWRGTGVEDFFGGGFYFDRGPFVEPLHGLLERRRAVRLRADGTPRGQPRRSATSMLRWLLLDAPSFRRSLQVLVETGARATTPMRWRATSFLYRLPESNDGDITPPDAEPRDGATTDPVSPSPASRRSGTR